MPTSILLVGAGAVGAFYASRLAQVQDTEVSVVCRSNYKVVKDNGFSIESPQYRSYRFVPKQTFANPDEARKFKKTWHYILVSTKALPDVSDDSRLLEDLVSTETSVVLIQNGLGIEEPYAKRFPHATILSAVTIVSAAQTSPGVIKHNRWTRISIGPFLPSKKYNEKYATQQNERLVNLFHLGGIKDAEAYDHAKLQLVRWHKIAINASMNPSSVLSGGASNNVMATDPELQLHLKGVMEEVMSTAPKIIGRPFPKEFASAEAILKSTMKNTSGSRPSMWLDWESGKRMEIEVILGNPIRIARAHGLDMPRLQSLYALLRMAQENREENSKRSDKSKL